ncbi:unnamed protein product [Clavelina lepadiformis]|uniref:Rho GTPase-activating protein 17 n=1 Tax=Clavelina lepadiformis TaxID=159417 RepID=A0ABP0GZ70_CLALP
MRYKLIADQKVGRANKNEVLNEELLQVEKHMEHVKAACQTTCKKLSQCMQTHGAGDYEKRLKRLPETILAQSMQESSKSLLSEANSNHLLGNALKVCAEAQLGIAKEKAIYEMFIDEHIISPLQTLVETEIPGVLRQRERLKRLVLDRDNALQNHQKAHKAQFNPGVNLQQTTAKADSLRDEYDQAVIRMEQCKDQLVTEMFEYLSKEAGHGQRMSDFHAKELDYHKKCVSLLEKLEPELKAVQDNAIMKSSFGRSLSEHLKCADREIAGPLEACVLCLLELGLKEEGLFRIAGGATKLRKFRALVDGGVLDLAAYDAQDDIHAVAGALKQYLRELPDPLLTHYLYNDFLKCSSIQDNDKRLQEIWTVIEKLPAENKANFRYLVKFCAVVAANQDLNKMSASNLALVLAPNLLWSNISDIGKQMMESNLITNIIELIITYSDWFFPGEIDFVVTPNATSYNFNNKDNNSMSNEMKPHAQSQPVPLSPNSSSKQTHSRNSSSDFDQVGGGYNTTGRLKKQKQKSKAPPPPQIQTSKTHERTKSSPPIISAPISPPPTNGIARPPIAAKRTSMRKPQMPPPQPPPPSEDITPISEEQASGNGKVPKAKPRPPARKHFSDPPPPVRIQDVDLSNPTELCDDPESPPMPNLPPPPLPSELDIGASLTSELKLPDAEDLPEDDGVELTQL